MNVVKTSDNGIVNSDTIFNFNQCHNTVTASYSGGLIRNGFITGRIYKDTLEFAYCQIRTCGKMDHGLSVCSISKENGKLILIESFEMTTNAGIEIGENIFKEI